MAKQKEKPIQELLNFGIINIDKPCGPTSFTVSEYVMRQLKGAGVDINKTSHFGTLDPKVTGVLPVALRRACKLTGFFLGHDKEYVGILHTHKERDMKELQEIINKNFIGKIKQLPPKKSRVRREIREREVKKFELLETSEDKKNFIFLSKVQGGTYIRKLCSDLGEFINGAHMLELRRIRAGVFDENKSYNLYEFKEAVDEFKEGNEKKLKEMIDSGEDAIKEIMEVVESKKSALKQLLTGKPLFKRDILGKTPKFEEGKVFAVFCGGNFIEIAEKTNEKGKDVFARALFVYN